MKTVLAILCALMVLAAGAVALVLVYSGLTGTSGAILLALVPATIAVLNALVLAELKGEGRPHAMVFYVLAVLDVAAAGLAAKFWSAILFQVSDIWTIAAPVVAVMLVKAVLSVLVARRLPQG